MGTHGAHRASTRRFAASQGSHLMVCAIISLAVACFPVSFQAGAGPGFSVPLCSLRVMEWLEAVSVSCLTHTTGVVCCLWAWVGSRRDCGGGARVEASVWRVLPSQTGENRLWCAVSRMQDLFR